MLPSANQVDRAVHRDPVEPRAEVRPRLEPAKLPVRLQEGFLHDVLGVLGTAGHPVRQPVHGPAVALDESLEGFAVAIPRECDGGGVRLRHPND